jgi:LPS-assembly protein
MPALKILWRCALPPLLSLLLWGQALCAPAPPRQEAWALSADDHMISIADDSIVELSGKVTLRMGEDRLHADFARYFKQTGWIYLSGHVEIYLGQDRLFAREAEFDLHNREGWLTDGRIFMAETNHRLQGESIVRHRDGSYSFRQMKFTACDGETPAWSFTAADGSLEVGGYARLRGASFKAADMPLAYSPYLLVAIKTERQTGFLLPDYFISDKTGLVYTQPFFLAIDPSRDLSLYESYMSERGFMHGLTYRSSAAEDENLWLGFDYLRDRQAINSDLDDRHYGGDNLIRPDKNRYWLRGMYNARLPGAPLWQLRADLDYVSDQYYLRDFKRSLNSLARNNNALYSTFSRELKDLTEDRSSTLLFFREWTRTGLYLSGSYSQNPQLGNGDPLLPHHVPASAQDDTVQRLPELNLYLHQGRLLPGLPLELRASGQAAHMYRREGVRGSRLDISPRLNLPLSGTYGAINAAARLRHTRYYSNGDNSALETRTQSRNAVDMELHGSTEFSRIYAFSGSSSPQTGQSRNTALRHSILPRLTYRYAPNPAGQSENPFYTEYDRLAPLNELVWSVDNLLTSRSEIFTASEEAPRRSYRDLLRLRLEQAYDLNEARRTRDLNLYKRSPWRDILAELTLLPGENISWSSSSYFTPQEKNFTTHSSALHLRYPDLGGFSASLNLYRPLNDYKRQRTYSLTTTRLNADLLLGGGLSAAAYYELPIKGEGGIQGKDEKGLTLTYAHPCFSLSGQVIRDEKDFSFKLWFSLSGLGF